MSFEAIFIFMQISEYASLRTQKTDQYLITEDSYADEACDAFTQVEETSNGFKISMSVPAAYYGYIIGKKGETRRRIENETKTQIRIPRQGEDGDVGGLGY